MGGKLSDWKGTLTSEMVYDPEGRNILTWVLTLDNIDPMAKDIIEEQLAGVFE